MISMDSKLREVLDNPEAAAVLNEVFPDIEKVPEIKLAYSFTLRQLFRFPKAKAATTPESIKLLEEKLAALNK